MESNNNIIFECHDFWFYHLVNFLDALSLNQLRMTCKYFLEVFNKDLIIKKQKNDIIYLIDNKIINKVDKYKHAFEGYDNLINLKKSLYSKAFNYFFGLYKKCFEIKSIYDFCNDIKFKNISKNSKEINLFDIDSNLIQDIYMQNKNNFYDFNIKIMYKNWTILDINLNNLNDTLIDGDNYKFLRLTNKPIKTLTANSNYIYKVEKKKIKKNPNHKPNYNFQNYEINYLPKLKSVKINEDINFKIISEKKIAIYSYICKVDLSIDYNCQYLLLNNGFYIDMYGSVWSSFHNEESLLFI